MLVIICIAVMVMLGCLIRMTMDYRRVISQKDVPVRLVVPQRPKYLRIYMVRQKRHTATIYNIKDKSFS